MRWKQFEFWVPIPSIRFSPRFSLRFLLVIVGFTALASRFYEPVRVASCRVRLRPTAAGTIRPGKSVFDTSSALLKSPFVINSAVRRAGVQQLKVLRASENPIEWIRSRLNVSTPEGTEPDTAQLTIVTRGGDVRELQVLVDAVADAYEQEVLATRTTPPH
jgi:hypothetical protein